MKHSDLKLKNQDREDFYEVRDKQIYEDLEDAEVFRIKGPLGRGLQIEQGGVHVAFCGGTGLLVFIDLVAHLIFRNSILATNRVKNVPDALKQLDHSFIFLLFVSVPTMDYICGLDLCEALVKVNRKLGFRNFKLQVRVSQRHDGGKDRTWDYKYLEENLLPYTG